MELGLELARASRFSSRLRFIIGFGVRLGRGAAHVGLRGVARRRSRDWLHRDAAAVLNGVEHENTLIAANNYADSLNSLKRFKEAKALMRKTIPVARRVIGESHDLTLRIRWTSALALYGDGDLREAVMALEDIERIARRVMGGANPITVGIEENLQLARAKLLAQSNT